MKKEVEIVDEGINGLGIGIVNTNSNEFKELQRIIKDKSIKQSKSQILENKLISIRFEMEDYLENNENSIIEVGFFLKKFLNQLEIKNKTFAEYIHYKESNLSALFAGRRKINFDLALKLANIFQIEPTLWINIQSKNELIKLNNENKKSYRNYNLKDLIKKAG